MANANMELDSPEQQQQREPEVIVEDRALAFEIADVAAITPPQSTSNTPQRNSAVPVPEQQMREIDSAAPESPSGSRDYDDNMEDLSSSDEDKNDRAVEPARPPTRPSRKGFSRSAARRLDMADPNISDESERVEHTDFFNDFGQDWLTTQ
ncbi:hypothetical protein GGI13_008522 [Coemansia sp. RSA 455]|nr:hypothetical protein GGI13_008522 [Coemansia sp. RSA 455]